MVHPKKHLRWVQHHAESATPPSRFIGQGRADLGNGVGIELVTQLP
jgi:hypothetical protein